MEKISKLKALIGATEAYATKFYERGNSAAGTRYAKPCRKLKYLHRRSGRM